MAISLTPPRILFCCILIAVFAIVYQVYVKPANNVLSSDKRDYRHIAIYNGLPYHYEMYGYIMDYCKKRNIKLDIFTGRQEQYGWLDLYNNQFGSVFTMHNKWLYNPKNNYDATVFTTSSERFPDSWLNEKSVLICHIPTKIRQGGKVNLATRFMADQPKLPYCLPVVRFISLEEKKRISTPRIVCVGSNVPKDVDSLQALVPNFQHYPFILINRKINTKSFQRFSNIQCIRKASASELVSIMRESDYVMILRTNPEDGYNDNKMSGSIPTALGCLCTLLIPEEMNKHYKFESVIPYGPTISIQPANYAAVDAELELLDSRKLHVLDSILF